MPAAMERIVLTAMAKDVDERYQSAQDLRSDLLRFERGRPLVGAPVTAVAREIPTAFVAAPVVAAAPSNGGAPPPATRRPQKRRWGPIVAVGIALALLLGLIVFLLVNADLGGDDTPTATLEVPRVTGLPYSQAEAGLTALGFTVAPRRTPTSPRRLPTSCSGRIPEAGRKIPKDGLITLTVSSPTITMPNVVGQPRAVAGQTLATANLNRELRRGRQRPATGHGVGDAIRRPGAPVAKLPTGDRPTVTVTVAREPAIPVPDVSHAGSVRGRRHPRRRRLPGDAWSSTPSDTVPRRQR